MSVRIACLVILVALAGCSEGGPSSSDGDGSLSDTTSAAPGSPTSPTVPEPVTRHLDWNGSLTVGAWLCENTVTNDCMAHPSGSFGTDHAFEELLGNVTMGSLKLEWTPATPLTQELVLEAVVLTPGCDDCNRTMLPGKVGPSPLVLDLPTDLRFAAGEVLFVAVYSNQYTAADQGAAGTSGDQDFRVFGDVTLL